MRILLLGDCNNPHTQKWCTAFRTRGHDVHLFSFTGPNDADRQYVEHNRFWSLNLPASFPSRTTLQKAEYFRSVPVLRRLARAIKPDVVNAHFASSYGLVAALARLRPLCVSVWGCDIYDWPIKSPVHRFVMRKILDAGAAVLSTSAVMGEVARTYTRRPIHITPFGVDIDQFAPSENKMKLGSINCFNIGTVKALEEKYGIEYLIRALPLVRAELPNTDTRLHIYGDGSMRKSLEATAATIGVGSEVTFHGRIKNSAVPEAFWGMDVAVFPSIYDSESFGVAAIEAQACGVPVVASCVGGLRETVLEGKTGFLVPPKDIRALADAIMTMIRQPDRREAMVRAARDHVVAKYDLELCIDLMEAAFYAISSKRPQGWTGASRVFRE